MRSRGLLFVAAVGCAAACGPRNDDWQGKFTPSYELWGRFPGLQPRHFNYVAYTHWITSRGLDVSVVEAALDSVFAEHARTSGYKKTKRGRAIVYQCDHSVPDFDTRIVAEKDGKTYVPSQFGYVWLDLPRLGASNPRMQTDAAVNGDGGDEGK